MHKLKQNGKVWKKRKDFVYNLTQRVPWPSLHIGDLTVRMHPDF